MDHVPFNMDHVPSHMDHSYMELVLLNMVHVLLNHVLSNMLTSVLVLFLICLYISSHALSKVFEHRNFVKQYQVETNHIWESCAPGNYGR